MQYRKTVLPRFLHAIGRNILKVRLITFLVALLSLANIDPALADWDDLIIKIDITPKKDPELDPLVSITGEIATNPYELGAGTFSGVVSLSQVFKIPSSLDDLTWHEVSESTELRVGVSWKLSETPLAFDSYLLWTPRDNWRDSLRPEFGGGLGPFDGGPSFVVRAQVWFLPSSSLPQPDDGFLYFDRIEYLMTPVPEPDQYWMLGIGLVILAGIRPSRVAVPIPLHRQPRRSRPGWLFAARSL